MKKLKWIMLAMVLCLGLVGGAYATWVDTVEVNVTGTTGNIDLEFGSSAHYGEAGTDGYSTHNAIRVADVNGINKAFEITIGNAYPNLYNRNVVEVRNNGSIPVKVTEIKVTGDTNIPGALLVTISGVNVGDVFLPNKGTVKKLDIVTRFQGNPKQSHPYSFTVEIVGVQSASN